jgi:hypothetical protein
MNFVDTSIKLLGGGSLVFGVWGLIHPESLTGVMGDDAQLGRRLGIRDTVIGVALLKGAGPVAVSMRCASDLHDAIRLRERSPIVALGAAAIAVWGAATFVATVRRDRHLSLRPVRRA